MSTRYIYDGNERKEEERAHQEHFSRNENGQLLMRKIENFFIVCWDSRTFLKFQFFFSRHALLVSSLDKWKSNIMQHHDNRQNLVSMLWEKKEFSIENGKWCRYFQIISLLLLCPPQRSFHVETLALKRQWTAENAGTLPAEANEGEWNDCSKVKNF